MGRVLAVVGLLGASAFVALYGPELFSHHGPPLTVAWLRAHIGDPGLVALNVAAGLAFLLLLPYRRDCAALWRSKGAFAAFVIALMTEMFGWPLLLWLFALLVEIPSLGHLTSPWASRPRASSRSAHPRWRVPPPRGHRVVTSCGSIPAWCARPWTSTAAFSAS